MLVSDFRNDTGQQASACGGVVDVRISDFASWPLGFSPEEAAILQMRADLMADLVGGKWKKLSLEMLIILATRPPIRVHIETAA